MSFRLFFPGIFFISNLCEAMQEKSFFQASHKQPYHLSIGAVLFNEQGLIACHHFKEILGQKEQGQRFKRVDADESEIIKRALLFFQPPANNLNSV